MKKTLLFAFFVMGLATGCTASKPTSPELSDREKVVRLTQLCGTLHTQHQQDKKYTDCSVTNHRIKFVFADEATYKDEARPVASMVQAYCFSSQGMQQQTLRLTYVWRFQKEGVERAKLCPEVQFVKPPQDFTTESK